MSIGLARPGPARSPQNPYMFEPGPARPVKIPSLDFEARPGPNRLQGFYGLFLGFSFEKNKPL
ncbi:unnamed protein product [Arabidopsis halleri]